MVFKERLKKIDAHFRQHQVRAVLLKGLSLAERYYPNPQMRSFGDLDLLVSQKDFQKAEQVLQEMGGKRDSGDIKWDGNRFKSVWLFDCTHVELHGSLLYEREFDPFEGHTRRCTIDGILWVEELSAEINFVYLCGHHAFQHLFDELYWLMDLDLLIRKENLNWRHVKKIAKDLKLRKAVYASTYILKKQFKTPLPKKMIKRSMTNFLIGRFVNPENILSYAHKPPSFYYLFLKAILRDRVTEMISYSFKRLFQKKLGNLR